MATKEKNNTDKATGKESTKNEVLEITGEPKKDFATFKRSMDYEFGQLLLEHYAPRNLNLIKYFKCTEDMNYLLFNLKVITNARS